MRRLRSLFCSVAISVVGWVALQSWTCYAQELVLAKGLVGNIFPYTVQTGDYLASIAARFGVADQVIARDNTLSEPYRLRIGQALTLDNRHLVPEGLDDGIVINVPQRLLFLFEQGRLVAHYPVGLGRPDWRTPAGDMRIATMQMDKEWIVPPSIQAEMQREGRPVVESVPPGPDNPLGRHWMGLSKYGIGIHGTIAPASVYRFRSHGCIRLHPDDAADLYTRARKGMNVRITYAPAILARLEDGRVFAEVNADVYAKAEDPLALLQEAASLQAIGDQIDWAKLEEVAARQEGIARDVSRN